jgi:gamma-glutamyltranspeptidase/glutathione hydrolase
LIEKHGSLSLSEILAPAIRLAEEGFPVGPLTSHSWARGADMQLKSSLNGHELTIDGRAPKAGEIFRNPGLAKTLSAVVREKAAGFYQGPIAESIVGAIREAGGCMSEEDLALHVSTWESPISVNYRGLRVHECPPNGQGITALIALNLLEGFDLTSLDPLSPKKMHLMIEALRLAFADARWYVADPAFSKIPMAELLSKETDLRLDIEGHTSSDGNFNTNMRLSRERAETVKNYLIKKGVDPARLTSQGFGPTKPLNEGKTEEERALNRRVELKMRNN